DPLISQGPPPPKPPPAQASNRSINVRKEPVEDGKELLAKPATCVTLGDVLSQCAVDENRTPQERHQYSLKAQDAYRRALQQDAKFVKAYVGLAKVQEATGDREGAQKTWQAAVAKIPKDPTLWFEHGMYLGRRQDYDQARASLEQAAKLD